MNVWFCSDFHFGHKLMMRTRNFETIEEHDNTLINNFNSLVKQEDVVYFLGDFTWGNIAEYLSRLNGSFHIIFGNHDKSFKNQIGVILRTFQGKILTYTEGYLDTSINKQHITLCHFPMVTWEKSHYDSWHLFGHHHSSFCMPEGKVMNVTMDALNMKPISWDEVVGYMDKRSLNWDSLKRRESIG